MAKVIDIMDREGVYWQIGELGAVDVGGGGTIAQFVAHMDVDVVDLGVPILSMHAPFELASKLDVYNTYKAFKAFYNKTGHMPLPEDDSFPLGRGSVSECGSSAVYLKIL